MAPTPVSAAKESTLSSFILHSDKVSESKQAFVAGDRAKRHRPDSTERVGVNVNPTVWIAARRCLVVGNTPQVLMGKARNLPTARRVESEIHAGLKSEAPPTRAPKRRPLVRLAEQCEGRHPESAEAPKRLGRERRLARQARSDQPARPRGALADCRPLLADDSRTNSHWLLQSWRKGSRRRQLQSRTGP